MLHNMLSTMVSRLVRLQLRRVPLPDRFGEEPGVEPEGPLPPEVFAATMAVVGGLRATLAIPPSPPPREAAALRMMAFGCCEMLGAAPADAEAVERCGGFDVLEAQMAKVFDPVSLCRPPRAARDAARIPARPAPRAHVLRQRRRRGDVLKCCALLRRPPPGSRNRQKL
jgi:hypothetical protein